MNFIITTVITFGLIQLYYVQADLSVVTHDIEVIKVDPNYLKDIDIYVLDNGHDNEFFVNFTILDYLPTTSKVHLVLLGFSLGEYVVPTGIDFSADLCESGSDPIFTKHIYKSLGMIGECPTSPGVYGNKQLVLVNTENLPKTFPPNKYKMEISFTQDHHYYCQINTYFDIQ